MISKSQHFNQVLTSLKYETHGNQDLSFKPTMLIGTTFGSTRD